MDFMSFIYLLTNKSLINTVKVGMTTSSPEKRASELHTTGIPTPFEVAASWEVPLDELRSYEAKAHKALGKYRVSKNREFFEVDANQAIKIINKLIPTPEQIAAKKIIDEQKALVERIRKAEKAVRRRKQLKEEQILELQQKKHLFLRDKEAITEKSIEFEKILSKKPSFIAWLGSKLDSILNKITSDGGVWIVIYICVISFVVIFNADVTFSKESVMMIILEILGKSLLFWLPVFFGMTILIYAIIILGKILNFIWSWFTKRFNFKLPFELVTHAEAKQKLHFINNDIKSFNSKMAEIDNEIIELIESLKEHN
jgi:hypothetical protein